MGGAESWNGFKNIDVPRLVALDPEFLLFLRGKWQTTRLRNESTLRSVRLAREATSERHNAKTQRVASRRLQASDEDSL